jgi:hypothetical protein
MFSSSTHLLGLTLLDNFGKIIWILAMEGRIASGRALDCSSSDLYSVRLHDYSDLGGETHVINTPKAEEMKGNVIRVPYPPSDLQLCITW